MDNLSPAQYDRFEAYRRYALSKQAVRKVSTLCALRAERVVNLARLGHPTNDRKPSLAAGRADYRRFREGIRGRNGGERFVLTFLLTLLSCNVAFV